MHKPVGIGPTKLLSDISNNRIEGRLTLAGKDPENSLALKSRTCKYCNWKMETGGVPLSNKLRDRFKVLRWSKFANESAKLPTSFFRESFNPITLPEKAQVTPSQSQQLGEFEVHPGIGDSIPFMKCCNTMESLELQVGFMWAFTKNLASMIVAYNQNTFILKIAKI
ncbi:hypothetical protein Hanom_Chr11g00973501 [Helianthus anomalus]